ncbi:hypothetical protein MYIN104542_16070 [Mycobacterium intermedium]
MTESPAARFITKKQQFALQLPAFGGQLSAGGT